MLNTARKEEYSKDREENQGGESAVVYDFEKHKELREMREKEKAGEIGAKS
jgi:hypothetical protein